MSDKGRIGAGLAVFVLLAAFPIWYGLVFGGGASLPVREPPKDGSRCIEEDMVAKHMDILNRWRHAVVRGDGGQQYHVSGVSGKQYPMSLTKTCMSADCHGKDTRTNDVISCDECHEYANVKPRCWDCHLDQKGN